MRQTLKKQPSLPPVWGPHQHSRELHAISKLLDAHPEVGKLARADLVGDARCDVGRRGMTGEQVVRALLVKQLHGLSYEELAFHLGDSLAFRSFCRLGFADRAPGASTLGENIKRLRPETLQTILGMVIEHAREVGIEKGRTVRADCTVVETTIHAPTDSSLLWDGIRTVTRLLVQAKRRWRSLDFCHADHRRRAKRRALDVQNAKSARARKRHYRDLLKLAGWVSGYGHEAVTQIERLRGREAAALAAELREALDRLEQVQDQATRRVLLDEQVPAAAKIVSIFEPHTDIIKKKRRKTEYGHKVWLCGGKSGLITDCDVLRGNPPDTSLATEIVERQISRYGRPPRQVAFDGGFTSRSNLAAVKGLGVKDACFHRKRGLKVAEMTKSAWVFKRLRDFRAGIEGVISTLKRVFGLDRCTWKGFASFRAYVYSAVLAYNLVVVARHLAN